MVSKASMRFVGTSREGKGCEFQMTVKTWGHKIGSCFSLCFMGFSPLLFEQTTAISISSMFWGSQHCKEGCTGEDVCRPVCISVYACLSPYGCLSANVFVCTWLRVHVSWAVCVSVNFCGHTSQAVCARVCFCVCISVLVHVHPLARA